MICFFFFSSRRRHTRLQGDWSSDVCSSDLYRRQRFTSLSEINRALTECVERINDRRHTRFGISRRERFETVEKAALKPLPIGGVDCGEWKDATLHADCYLYIDGDYYSAPHIHRHKRLRVKITENQVEIFLAFERLAVHARSRHRSGRRIFFEGHFPAASQAYYEATPQKLLSQSRFIHPELNQFVRGAVQCGRLRQHPPLPGVRAPLHQRDQPERARAR